MSRSESIEVSTPHAIFQVSKSSRELMDSYVMSTQVGNIESIQIYETVGETVMVNKRMHFRARDQ